MALIVLVTNCFSLALMSPRLKPRNVKPFTFDIPIFLDAPYVLFALGTCFSYHNLDWTT